MKNSRKHVIGLGIGCLMILAMASMTACGNDNKNDNGTTAQTTESTTMGTTNSTNSTNTTNASTSAGNTDTTGNQKETGVIDGVIDDIGEGVEDIGSEMTTTESTTAAR